MTVATLYDTDVLTWSEQQADSLRRLASADIASTVDWPNVIRSVENVGHEELQRIESWTAGMLTAVVKGFLDPDSHYRIRWSLDVFGNADNLRHDFRESMRARIDLDRLWREAFDAAVAVVAPDILSVPPGLPRACPFTLDDLLEESFTYDSAVRRLYDALKTPAATAG